jgi:hypothetical protein
MGHYFNNIEDDEDTSENKKKFAEEPGLQVIMC